MSQAIQNNNPQASQNKGVGAASSDSSKTSTHGGDGALYQAMLIQVEELNVLTNAATAESAVSVALRKTMQQNITNQIEEYQELMKLGAGCEGGNNFISLLNWIEGKGGPQTFSQLEKMFPNDHLEDVPSNQRGDFVNQVKLLFANPDPSHVTNFRTKVSTLGNQLQQYATFQTAAKNLADGYQNGAGSLTQSITQFLAQISTESGLMGDVVAQ